MQKRRYATLGVNEQAPGSQFSMVRCSAESDVLWFLPAAPRCWLVHRGPWEGAVFRVGLGAAVMIASASP